MTADDIEARIVEAAEIERRLPRVGERPDGTKTAWPAYFYTFTDRVGWDEARHRDDREARTMVPASVSRAEFGRWEEVRRWVVELVEEDKCRRALTAWSIAAAGGKPFSRFCRSEGVSRVTGYARKDKAIGQIATKLGLASVSSGLGSQVHALQECPSEGTFPDMMGEASPDAWMAPDARPTDNPEARDIGPGSWSAEQAERRRRRLAKLEREGA